MNYEDQLKAEAESWLAPDAGLHDKLLRERIRHPKLIRDLMLDRLPTHRMDIAEVGGGPLPVSDLLEFKSRVVIDPCAAEYRQIAPCPDHINCEIEHYLASGTAHRAFDLVICTNALDHVRDPSRALQTMSELLRPGGYMAIHCAENNAIVHKHPAHQVNLTVADVHRELDRDFETVSEFTHAGHGLRYGWVLYDGRRGQPAFAVLLRKCTGYGGVAPVTLARVA